MAKYTPDYAGIRRYLSFNPDLRRELHRRAILGQGVAVALAPWRTGELAGSSDVSDDGPFRGVHHDRMQFSINFTIRHAVPATFRKGHNQRAYLEAAVHVMEMGR